MAAHSQGFCCTGGVVEHQVGLQRRAQPVADHGEADVEAERHPVLVEGDEADHDEEVEVRLDRPARDHHEGDRAVGQAGGVEHRGQPAPGAGRLAEGQQDDRRQQQVGGERPGRGPSSRLIRNNAGMCSPSTHCRTRCRRYHSASSSRLPRGMWLHSASLEPAAAPAGACSGAAGSVPVSSAGVAVIDSPYCP